MVCVQGAAELQPCWTQSSIYQGLGNFHLLHHQSVLGGHTE